MKTIYLLISLVAFSSMATAQITGGTNPPQSFRLQPGETYVFSAWTKEDNPVQQINYSNCKCEIISHLGQVIATIMPTGAIIDGWQRLTGEFQLPDTAASFNFRLVAIDNNIDCYFDDIRVFPFNGNMKSFVYDPITQRLMAELDENNYATFYEYDIEGGLVRVKKETERGIKTIQETRSGNAKGLQ